MEKRREKGNLSDIILFHSDDCHKQIYSATSKVPLEIDVMRSISHLSVIIYEKLYYISD